LETTTMQMLCFVLLVVVCMSHMHDNVCYWIMWKLQNIMDGQTFPDYRMKFANKKGRF
jgi:hypothetical protein